MVAITRFPLFITATLLLGLPALAIPAEPTEALARVAVINGLLKRQTTGIPQIPTSDLPEQCLKTCTDVKNKATSCPDDRCFCTDANMRSFASCMDCSSKSTNGVITPATGQSAIDTLVGICNGEGFKVKSVTIGSSNSAVGISSTRALAVGVVGAALMATLA